MANAVLGRKAKRFVADAVPLNSDLESYVFGALRRGEAILTNACEALSELRGGALHREVNALQDEYWRTHRPKGSAEHRDYTIPYQPSSQWM